MKKIKALILVIIVLAIVRQVAKPGQPDVQIADTQETTETGTDTTSEEVEETSTEKEMAEEVLYTLQPSSQVLWTGKKVGNGSHNGYINIKDGFLRVMDDKIVGGKFTMDMTSIKATDVDDEGLDNHLKAEDFFDSANYNEAMFEVTMVEGNKVTGNLTLKDATQEISFDASELSFADDKVVAMAAFAIDRTQWGIEGGLPAISEFIELSLNLTFHKE